jgi:hypothetical protein
MEPSKNYTPIINKVNRNNELLLDLLDQFPSPDIHLFSRQKQDSFHLPMVMMETQV